MILTEQEKTDLYAEYSVKVQRYLQSRLNNREIAEDLCTDVFMKVFEKLDSYDKSKASISTWIFTITRNSLIDYYRTRRVFSEVPETLPEDSAVEDEICNNETLASLAGALEKLDERLRDIVVMRYYSGLTLKEIGQKMGISYAYVKMLHNRALSDMKELLAGSI